jgi:anaerobic selenocysteine-containing dehydrogenase
METHIHQPHILLSRPDAKKLDVANGDQVMVSQNGTSVELPVQVNRRLEPGLVVVPRNVAGQPAEKLLGPNGFYTTVEVEKK